MFKCILLVLLSQLLISCAVQYAVPSSGETALLVLPGKESSWKLFGGFSNASVRFAIKGENGCGKVYKNIEPKHKGSSEVEVVIPANRDIFVSLGASSGNSVCSVAGFFTALPSKEYKVVNVGGGYGCAVGVVEFAEDGQSKSIALQEAYADPWTGTTICDKR